MQTHEKSNLKFKVNLDLGQELHNRNDLLKFKINLMIDKMDNDTLNLCVKNEELKKSYQIQVW